MSEVLYSGPIKRPWIIQEIFPLNIADLQDLFISMDPQERKRRLDRMVWRDPNTKRWHCCICEAHFSRKHGGTDHIEGAHLKILSYACFYCERKFACTSQRRNHIFTNHREQNKMARFLTE